jgi:hypothetical protein
MPGAFSDKAGKSIGIYCFATVTQFLVQSDIEKRNCLVSHIRP